MRSRLFALWLFLLAWQAALATNPLCAQTPDLTLTVHTSDGRSIFRIGELIRLELAFTSSASGRYQVDTASYDRSGRLKEEKFAVEPSWGWDDPLAAFFHSYEGFMMGGLRGYEVLSGKPTLISIDLNEWVRFRAPGHYKVTITSARVSRLRAPFGSGGSSVTSNPIELTIVPATKAWQVATLKSALEALDQKIVKTDSSQADARQRAVKVLRYLGTGGAAQVLAQRLTGGDSDWDFAAGLMGTPARDEALQQMTNLLVNPNFPVTSRFISTLSVLSVTSGVDEQLAKQRERAEGQYRQELTDVLASKRGAALAFSTNTIIEDAAVYSRPLRPDLKSELTQQLINVFDNLPIEKQAEIVQYRWSALDHQQMLPLVRRIAKRYSDFSELREMNAYQFNQASGAALQHWYELAPDEARPAIILEIVRLKPRFNASVLGILPDKELSEVDQSLADHLNPEQTYEVNGNIASLIHRYASSAIEARVTGFLDPQLGKLACEVQDPLLAYVVKVDPEAARPRVEAAMAARGEGYSACNHMLLAELGRLQNDPMLQDAALKILDDSDPQVVESAAEYLGKHGSATVEDALWARFTSWSEHWKGRDSELQYVPGVDMTGPYQQGAGTQLIQALATGQSWLTDEAKLKRLMDLAVESQKPQLEQYLARWRTRPWSIQFVPFEKGQFEIAQYHEDSLGLAEDKLLQFPAGSIFAWVSAGGGEQEQQALSQISHFANEHGLKVVVPHN